MHQDSKQKRILWLINHTTLREFEVPLICSLGYEVFTPKYVPHAIFQQSGSIDYGYDKTLTIPQEVLDRLNQHDFYDGPMTSDIAQLLNQYFDTAFCVTHSNTLKQLLESFEGRILLRVFGVEKESSYTKLFRELFGPTFLSRIQAIGERFWFSQAYPNLYEIEGEVFTQRRVTHPIGLSPKFFAHQDEWCGGVNKVLFFCSRIDPTQGYYFNVYKNFKRNFGDIPHTIAGNQLYLKELKDKNIAGEQPRETIEQWLRTYDVMFYHSEEPRHLHYNPLEAIVFGMPLIYMQESLLGTLGGDNQPGACATIKEAREKLKRVLKGERVFIEKIRQQQKRILHTFTFEYCRPQWIEHFVEKIMATPIPSSVQKSIKKIAIFLPVAYRGGTLNGAKNLAKMLYLGSRHHQQPVEVVFSCVEKSYDVDRDFEELLRLGIQIRETEWKTATQEEMSLYMAFAGKRVILPYANYLYPTDGVSNFEDCDFWMLVSERTLYPLAPFKPYGVLVYDYLQRYVPTVFTPNHYEAGFINTVRKAQFVLTTTPTAREDAIQYAGIAEERVHVLPMEFNPYVSEETPELAKKMADSYGNYFIWTTNLSPHKNHLLALEALEIYYSELDGKFRVALTGVNSEELQKKNGKYDTPYIRKVRKVIQENELLKKNIVIMGELPLVKYIAMLAASKFLWHPLLKDNGSYSVVEAAYYGVPSLSGDYPEMHFMNQRFQLNLLFAAADHPKKMAKQLKIMENEYSKRAEHLPSRAFFEQFTAEKLAGNIWEKMEKYMNFFS